MVDSEESQTFGVPDGLIWLPGCIGHACRIHIPVVRGDGPMDSVFREVGRLVDERNGFGTNTVVGEFKKMRAEVHYFSGWI